MFHVIFSYRGLQNAKSFRAESSAGGYFGWSDRYGARDDGDIAQAAIRTTNKPVFIANW